MNEVKRPPVQRSYINVMEKIVVDEVNRQLHHVPGRVRRYLKIEEIVTYALNRLPTLYASSEKGLEHQQQQATRNLGRQVESAVRQAIAAVQVDPLRLSQPLYLGHPPESEAVLQALRALFNLPELDWQQALVKLSDLKNDAHTAMPQTYPESWQPGQYTSQVAWTHRRRRPRHLENEPLQPAAEQAAHEPRGGWDDPRYRL
ncbi:late competence development ComFB family protein [Leptolyngbya iicbica]|uniref:Late competence development ComFB family protein n=2 Tax=Cyanophyceae TaxID=3028117 RepID=A0A4Q7EHQ9_9CYAN|nr:late competence development ComFB family protein [Leptolyngbya sp. LK]RZM82657.1 hypothetical protein DYY88_05365 [Leptolyngbya sp. LK]